MMITAITVMKKAHDDGDESPCQDGARKRRRKLEPCPSATLVAQMQEVRMLD